MKRLFFIHFILLASFVRAAFAENLGVHGEIFPIGEPDLVESIRAELGSAAEDGRLARFNEQVAGQVTAIDQPPNLGLSSAQNYRSWLYDTSITLNRDIRDNEGRIVVARGTRVNPLERIGLREPLLFADGSNEKQMLWALGQRGKIVLTGGSPGRLSNAHDRQMFFDQKSVLTNRFGIRAVPAKVSQEGLFLKIEEIPVGGGEE